LVLLALMVSTVSFADTRVVNKPKLPNASLGDLYDRSEIFRYDEGPVSLPRPVDPETGPTPGSAPGPIAMEFDPTGLPGAIATPRGGGSIYTQKQQADQDIKKLIRRLD
jgi:hypothetical protein